MGGTAAHFLYFLTPLRACGRGPYACWVRDGPSFPLSILAYLNAMLLRGASDALLDRLDLARVILRCVVLMVDVRPCRAYVLVRVYRVLVVRRVRVLHVPIFALPLFGAYIVSAFDLRC